MKTLLAGIALAGLISIAHAAGPAVTATADRSLWPDPIDSPAAFDRASRAEILVFAQALSESANQDDAALKTRLRLKEIDRTSLERVRTRMWRDIVQNYVLAAKGCKPSEPFCTGAHDRTTLQAAAQQLASLGGKYQSWYANAQAFHRAYCDEQLRLAALFPRSNSEIDTLDASERRGDELVDRTFLLTFDDGPTRAGGETERVVAMLGQHKLSATFFVLGENLVARVKQNPTSSPDQIYAGNCVGMHGWEHTSHARLPEWQSSVTRSMELVQQSAPRSYVPLFRPPYGQRTTDSRQLFLRKALTVVLWNIDSQDWSNRVDTQQVGDRVMSLMLLWRHGVILFHDIHPKATQAVPWLLTHTQGANVQWADCHDFPAKGARQ